MRLNLFTLIGFAFGVLPILSHEAFARDLTFEDRVKAQEAIERVYYSHQVGTSKPFEEAVGRDLLETRVRTYLKETVALRTYWATPVTAEMLRQEAERMVRMSKMPARLRELNRALGDDPFLIQECLARPALVSRLNRNFFASDRRFHAVARSEIETLRTELIEQSVTTDADDVRRHVMDVVLAGIEDQAVPSSESAAPGEAQVLEVPPDRYEELRNQAPDTVGEIGPIEETRERFAIRVVLGDWGDRFRLATYVAEKRTYDSWWSEVGMRLDESSVSAVASSADVSPPLPDSGSPAAMEASPGDCAQGSWDNQSLDTVPDARSGFTTVWTGSLMVIWGGAMSSGLHLSTGGRYDPATDTWSSTAVANAPIPRTAHAAVWTGQEMLIWGGATAGGLETNTGGRYNPISDSWLPLPTTGAPIGRGLVSAVWSGREMLLWGGGSTYDGGRFDPVTNTWRTITTPPYLQFTTGNSLVWTGSKMIVWGGRGNGNYNNTGGMYDPGADSWTPTSTTNAPSGRNGHVAVWTGTSMVVWGGYDGSNYPQSGGRFDPVMNSWTPTSLAGSPFGRVNHTGVWTGKEIVVWAGDQGTFFNTNSGGRYDPLADTWSPTTQLNAPAERSRHGAVWTGSLMVVWGGNLVTGGRYDPVADVWTPTSVMGQPSARAYHTAVWTGNQMIVWGGVDRAAAFNTGGRYDPALDLWVPTSAAGAPSARYLHTAIWSGQEMIVWGGRAFSFSALSSGGRYDPATDSWRPVSMVNAPAARLSHTAVWTGHLMIVYGGATLAGDQLGSGAKYDPANDAWTPIASFGGRTDHTAVWTGSLMLVWGGISGSSLVSNGLRYDPNSNTWSQMALVGAPIPRSLHEAVWTGSQMLVWGGKDCVGSCTPSTQSGGRYDPVANSWSPMTTVGAPGARSEAAGVWTGSEFVIWGGVGQSSLNTGGRYNPATNVWSATSLLEAPINRERHTAVWTGNSVLVWGGSQAFAYLESGGLYCACPGPPTTYYQDADRDGYGDPGVTVQSCADPVGYVRNGMDCDERHADIHPGASELCDGIDNNCDGRVDETFDVGKACEVMVDACHRRIGVLECRADATGNQCNGPVTFFDAVSPTLTCPQATTSECPAQPFVGTASAVDECDPTPSVVNDAPEEFSLGSTLVTWVARDASGNQASCQELFQVRDTTPPDVVCPEDAVAECPGVPVLGHASAVDACDRAPVITSDAPDAFPLGTTTVVWRATDASGNSRTCEQEAHEVDTVAPELSVSVTPNVLWPPNHRMVDTTVVVSAIDACSSPATILTSATSNEPDDSVGGGDGHASDDIQGAEIGSADFGVQLRAERGSAGNGRIYTLTYSAVDGSGNSTSDTVDIFVPHDQHGIVEPLALAVSDGESGTVIDWEAVHGAMTYSVIRGDIRSLRYTEGAIDLGAVRCVQSNVPALSTQGHEDRDLPLVGQGYFYLVAYNDGWGSTGYGSEGLTLPRLVASGDCQ